MQVDTEHERDMQALSLQVLQIVATSPDPHTCGHTLFKLCETILHASAGQFMTFGQSVFHVTFGDIITDQYSAYLADLASHLPAGVHFNPSVTPITETAHHLVMMIPAEDNESVTAGVVLIVPELSAIPDPIVDSLYYAFTILTGQVILDSQKTREAHLTDSVLSSIVDPLLIVNNNKQVIRLNPAAEAVFAISTDKASGQSLEAVVQSDELMALSEKKNKNLTEWVSKDNKTFIPRAEPIIDDTGNQSGWVLALRDITHFKKLNRNQYEFTRNVTHDLRSPLTSMQGFASMLEMGAVGEVNERQLHFVEKILSGITQITSIVDNIQDAGRYDPETGFYEMSRSQCDLNDLAHRIASDHLVPAEKQELKLSVQVSDDVPIINADSNMLERALRNLVDNAIKYTPNGGSIVVGVAKRDSTEVVISVKDSGLGISPENQKRLFERGVRIHRDEHKRVKGSGLGLFIVRSVAQRHSGDAWVESIEGKGSTFFMSIPLDGPNLFGTEEA